MLWVRRSNQSTLIVAWHAASRSEILFGSQVPAYLRSGLKPARTSSDKSCGCSQAAKWPPLSCFL